MRGLVTHHGVIRSLPRVAVIAVSTASVGLNVLIFERLQQGDVLGVDRHGLLQLIILLGGLGILLMREAGNRSTPWAQSLPVPARTLWTAHVRSLVLAVSLLVACMAVVIVGLSQVLRRLEELDFLSPTMVALHFARPWLVLLAVALMLGSWRPGLADPGRAAGWKRWRLILALGAVAVLLLLTFAPLPVALLPVLAAAAWARRVRNDLPPVLGLAERPDGATDDKAGDGASDGRRVLHWIIVRQLFKWPLNWVVGLPVVFLLGMVQGGALSTSVDADFARYFNVWISVYIMVAFIGYFLENLHRVDHLPISRGLVLRWYLVPVVGAMVLGGVVGTLIDLNRAPAESLVFENDTERVDYGLKVPMDVWLTVWGEPPATVEAPWGEVQGVSHVTVIEGLPLRIWKPYSTPAGASADFVAWQITRAVERVHGVALDPEVVRDRYLFTGPDGNIQVVEGGLTLLADDLVPARGPIGPLLGLLIGTTVVLALLTCWLIFRISGRGATLRRVRVAFWTTMGVLMALHLGGYIMLMTRTTKDWMVTGVVGGLAGRLGTYGAAGWLGTWLVATLLVLAAWRLCARAFARVEAVRGGSSYQL